MVVLAMTFLTLDLSKEIFTQNGMSVPNEVTPAQILHLINDRIFELGRLTWELMAGEPLKPPRYSPGFCRTRWCPHAAFAHVFCNRCCKVKFGVEVWQSTVKVGPNRDSQLGLFACRNFSANKYVCDWTWDIQLGHDCMSIISPLLMKQYQTIGSY
jgi:hypothetical protein